MFLTSNNLNYIFFPIGNFFGINPRLWHWAFSQVVTTIISTQFIGIPSFFAIQPLSNQMYNSLFVI
jgi:hypothetical protein